MPEISVIIPNYGHAGRIMDAVQSILDQTFQNFEILILNDDKRSLKSLEQIDRRIKAYDRVNGERHTSEWRLNHIVDELANYWAYQDADGFSYPKRLEKSLQFLKDQNADIITTDGVYVFKNGIREEFKYTEKDSQYGVGAMSSVFAKKEVLKKVLFSKEGYGSDGVWWYELKRNSIKYDHLELPLYKHLDYSSRFRKFKSIPVLRKLYRLAFLKPQVTKAIKGLKWEYGQKFEVDYGEI